MRTMRGRLHQLIFVGMALGVVGGVLLWGVADKSSATFTTVIWWLDLFGATLFVGALKMIIAPLILASIVAGVTSLPDVAELGRIGWKTFAYYFSTTAIAVTIGLGLVLVVAPGTKPASVAIRDARAREIEVRRAEFRDQTGKDPAAAENRAALVGFIHEREDTSQTAGAARARWEKIARAEGRSAGDIFKDDIVKPLLTNPFEALTNQVSLGIIFFSLLFGMACLAVGQQARPIVDAFQAANAAIMKLTTWIMSLSPVAIACLMASLVAKHGPEVFRSLGWYCATVIGGILIHVMVLVTIASVLGHTSPRQLYLGIREAWLIAFTTRSSAATLPITVKCVTEKLGISKQTANFVLPIGATINMDGTALYEGVAVIYLLQIFGPLDDVTVAIGGMTTLLIFITAVLASIGAAAVPDAGLVTMVLVANAVHLPVYYIPLIFAVDAFLDMFRTSTNVLGDVVGCTVVERAEGARLAARAA